MALKEGFRFVFRTPLIVWTMLIDFVATLLVAAAAAWRAPFLLGYDVETAVRGADGPRLPSGP